MFLYLDLSETKTCKDNQDFYMKRAAEVASNSNNLIHRHGTIIVNRKSGEIVSEGFNHYSESFCHTYSVHSEVSALQKIKKYPKHLIENLDMYIVRIGTDKSGRPLKFSKPCTNCAQAIIRFGIRNVFYSTDDNFSNKINGFKKTYFLKDRKY